MTGQTSDRRRFTGRRGLEGEIVDCSDFGGSGETSNMRSATAPTPEQMRALASEQESVADIDRNAVRAGLLRESAAALRAAADQLEAVEAVKQYVEDGEYENDEGELFVYTYSLRRMLGLAADTAPQEDRDE